MYGPRSSRSRASRSIRRYRSRSGSSARLTALGRRGREDPRVVVGAGRDLELDLTASLERHVVGEVLEDEVVRPAGDRGASASRPTKSGRSGRMSRRASSSCPVPGWALDGERDIIVVLPLLLDRGVGTEAQAERAVRAARRQEPGERPRHADAVVPEVAPRTGERLRGCRLGEQDRTSDGDGDEDRPATQVDRGDRRRVADAPPDPLGLFVEDVSANEQEERRDREDDQERSSSLYVTDMFPTRTMPTAITPLSGRR